VERPILPEILGQPAPVGAKSPIFSRYSLDILLELALYLQWNNGQS